MKNECPMCLKVFCDQSTALRHLKHVHAPPHPCDYCHKNIKIGGRPDVLRNHLVRCPNFVRLHPQTAYYDSKVEARKIYDRVKVDRDRAFQPHRYGFRDSGYLDVPESVNLLTGSGYQESILEHATNSNSSSPGLFPPLPTLNLDE